MIVFRNNRLRKRRRIGKMGKMHWEDALRLGGFEAIFDVGRRFEGFENFGDCNKYRVKAQDLEASEKVYDSNQ
jgi:hypothetical protein